MHKSSTLFGGDAYAGFAAKCAFGILECILVHAYSKITTVVYSPY